MKLDTLKINRMFSAYANVLQGRQVQYLCEKCSQQFSANWTVRANMFNPYVPRGSFVYCPYCGERHDRYIQHVNLGEEAPFVVELRTYAYKEKMVFKVKYQGFSYTGAYCFQRTWGEEIFSFDFKKKKSTFSKIVTCGNAPINICLPIIPALYDEIISNSMLRYFNYQSLINGIARSSILNLLKTFRNLYKSKLDARLKIKAPSVYVNASGSPTGLLLIPLLNFAHRLLNADASNLLSRYRLHEKAVLPMLPAWANSVEWVDGYVNGKMSGMDNLTLLIEAFGLPNLTVVRKILKEQVNDVAFLQAGFRFFKDENLAVRFAFALQVYLRDTYCSESTIPRMFAFIEELLTFYPAKDVVCLLEKAETYQFRDCIGLYKSLNEDNHKKLKEKRVRLRDLHDWMSIEHKKQGHVNVPLDIPEHIVKRLSMQADKLSFFVPQESIDLLKTGHVLKNCVASYEDRVKSGKCWIVVLTNNSGKYLACLRVENDQLKEAKLSGRSPVSDSLAINRVVLKWANEIGLMIDTNDVKGEYTDSSRYIA